MREIEKKLFNRLNSLYQEMDSTWKSTASEYDFQCNGCSENCCETEFYHHTYIEKSYLLHGFSKLPRPAMVGAAKRAQKVCTKRNIAAAKEENLRIMCPLNLKGKCILYQFRPMICRLHGIPHEVYTPLNDKVQNPGCDAGAPLFKAVYYPFDRTLFYSEMASLEKDFLEFKFKGAAKRIKQSVAQMLVKQHV